MRSVGVSVVGCGGRWRWVGGDGDKGDVGSLAAGGRWW